jgi:Ala-tRNA(Pro) deacylase
VDLERFREACHAKSVRLASEAELQPLYSDCELGAMPPLGPLYKQPVIVDKRLTSDPEILFNGGSHRDAIRMRYQDFEELVKPTIADFGMPMRES